jgi:hypothetical protein
VLKPDLPRLVPQELHQNAVHHLGINPQFVTGRYFHVPQSKIQPKIFEILRTGVWASLPKDNAPQSLNDEIPNDE